MASRARARLDQGGALVAGGTSTALTVTTNQSLSSAHIANGLRLCVRTASAATGAATIAIDGLTAVNIKKNDGSAIASGEWASGSIIDLVYSSAASAFIAANIGSVATRAGLGLATSDSPQFAGINVGNASDTTVTRASAGMIAVEGTTIEPGANRASFAAHKNGSNQAVATTAETQITFGTERYDQGSKFASNGWTPPAGTALVNLHVTVVNATTGQVYIRIKNGTTVVGEGIGLGAALITLDVTAVTQVDGSTAITAYIESTADSSYTVSGTTAETYFQGTMV